MSFVIRHPEGAYIQEWGNTVNGEWIIDRVELVPKSHASSYSKRSEARKSGVEIIGKFYPGVALEVEVR